LHLPCRVAILGSNSFAGSTFAAYALANSCEVLGISRSAEPDDIFLPYRYLPQAAGFRFFQLDLNRDFDRICSALTAFKPEVIADFAGQGMVAESWHAPEQWYQTNIVSKVRLHNFLKHQKWLKRFIRISTPEVYGSCKDLICEDQRYNPSTPYAVSHAAIDMSLKAFHQNYGFPVVFGRFANFYGEHQQLYRIIPKAILCVRSKIKLPLHGGGKSVRAFIHATEAAEGVARMIASGKPGEIYHFSPSRYYTIYEVVEIICRKLGCDIERATEIVSDRPGKDMAYLMDASKAGREIGWVPHIEFEDGISRTIAWIDRHLERMRALPWEYLHKP
jgi:dTDP-glucose 4,6-dehydratase